jgi:hypothetical protein
VLGIIQSDYAIMCVHVKRKMDLLSNALGRNIDEEVMEVSGDTIELSETIYQVTDDGVFLLETKVDYE